MPAVTRQGNTTTGICNKGLPCCPHSRSGTNQQGSINVFVNGQPVHRLHDTGATNCPHGGTFQSIAGSSSVFVNGQPVTRIGDATTCMSCGQSGSHSSGSQNVFAGG
ncbi:PAAR domain-containing protein [Pelosinus sp. IPA-1]|uniref:PAAR domain-containing protein n=1 Tax=Pelosinus sp. IPA-1 TaxID=3029569 RepID=UPI002436152C|nr:PAAR domain-containing protein [Pelosinus sp. IPA-1]GMB00225.1 hypothetical protein PIPA1_30240 [Pelosinus sp. IPA-1]